LDNHFAENNDVLAKEAYDELDFNILRNLHKITTIFEVALKTLEVKKKRTLHAVIPTYCMVYEELLNCYMDESNSMVSKIGKEGIKVCDLYFDGGKSDAGGDIKSRITDDMLVLAFLNPFDSKLAILEKPIEGKIPQSGVTPTALATIKLVLEERRKNCVTRAQDFLKNCLLVDEDEADDDDDEDEDEDTSSAKAVINFELNRFRKMGNRMRKNQFGDEIERMLADSNRSGSDMESFWTAKKGAYPHLSQIYLKLICSPASSSIVESSFLFLKNIQSGRSQLTPGHCDDLLQLFFDRRIQ